MSISQMVKNDIFLPSYAQSGLFSGHDSEELFQKNLKKMPSYWYYANHEVNYTINKHGYRTKEFESIDWAKSVVIFGCSNVFGIGLDDQDTISFQLSKMLGLDVVNMGVEGSSIDYSLANAVILKNNYPTPLAVINLWSGIDRTSYYNKSHINHLGPWRITDYYYRGWIKDKCHAEVQALIANKISKIMWKDTVTYEASIFQETCDLLNCDFLKLTDKSRDLVHPGIESAKQIAKEIYSKINL